MLRKGENNGLQRRVPPSGYLLPIDKLGEDIHAYNNIQTYQIEITEFIYLLMLVCAAIV